MMKQHTRRTTILRSLMLASTLCFGAISTVACTSKSTTDTGEEQDQEVENARESGVAEQAAQDTVIGEWRLKPSPHDALDLRAADIDVLNGLDERVKAGFAFEKDNTLRFAARLGEDDLQEKVGTWRVKAVELEDFTLEIQWDEDEATHNLTIEPRSDGDLDARIDSQEFVLRKASIDDYLAAPENDAPAED